MPKKFIPIITDKELPRYNKNPKIRAQVSFYIMPCFIFQCLMSRFSPQKLENVQTALKFVQSEGIRLVNIGSEDFVDHKLTLILGFIWTLILRYHIQKGGVSASAKNDLLKWVQSKIPHKNVTNFTTWYDYFGFF